MLRKKVTITEGQIRKLVSETVKNILENQDFKPQAGKAISNTGGIEMQIDNKGENARLRYSDGEVTDWLEIEFDEDGVAYVTTPYGEQERLCDYIRY